MKKVRGISNFDAASCCSLSPRHELFAKFLIIHKGNQTRAYLEVYKNCSQASAPSKASRLVRNGKVIARFLEFLTGDSRILKVFKDGLEANKVIIINGNHLLVPDHAMRLVTAKILWRMLDK